MYPMAPTPAPTLAALPEDVGVLQELVRGLLASHQVERQRNTELQERIDQLLRRLYGVKSDMLGQNQPGLFDGLEEGQPPEAEQPPLRLRNRNLVPTSAGARPTSAGRSRRILPG